MGAGMGSSSGVGLATAPPADVAIKAPIRIAVNSDRTDLMGGLL
jgi:hypothetical protein